MSDLDLSQWREWAQEAADGDYDHVSMLRPESVLALLDIAESSATGAREDAPGLREAAIAFSDYVEDFRDWPMSDRYRELLDTLRAATPSWPSPDDEVAVHGLAGRLHETEGRHFRPATDEELSAHSRVVTVLCDDPLHEDHLRRARVILQALSPTRPKPKETGERCHEDPLCYRADGHEGDHKHSPGEAPIP